MEKNANANARTSSACDFCRRRKTKCSGGNPCAYCQTHNLTCSYTYVKKKRATYKKRKEEIGSDSSRIAALESQVAFLQNQLDAVLNLLSSQGLKIPSSVLKSESPADLSNLKDVTDQPDTSSNVLPNISQYSNQDTPIELNSEQVPASPNALGPEAMLNQPYLEKHALESHSALQACLDEIQHKINQLCPPSKSTEGITKSNVSTMIPCGSSSIFSPALLRWIEALSPKNFQIFSPVLKHHTSLLHKITKGMRSAFNEPADRTAHLACRRDQVRAVVEFFMSLNLQSVLLKDNEIKTPVSDILNRFCALPSPNQTLSHSELLIISAVICLACVHLTGRDLDALGLAGIDLISLEMMAMRNCFFHFHRVAAICEGEETVVGILLLCLYLASSVFSRSAVIILSVACKHACSLGYHRLRFSSDNLTYFQRMLWIKLVLHDRTLLASFDRPPIIADPSVTDEDVVVACQIIIKKYMKETGQTLNPELDLLMSTNGSNRADVFLALHRFAHYSPNGFSLLSDYYGYLLGCVIQRAAAVAIPEYGGCALATALNEVSKVNNELKKWKACLPDNLKPGALDTSCYYIEDSAENRAAGIALTIANRNCFLVAQLEFYYHTMKLNKNAHRSCILMLLRGGNGDLRDYAVLAPQFETVFVEASRAILRILILAMQSNYQTIFWGSHYVLAAFFTVFGHILARFVLNKSYMVRPDDLSEILEGLYLLIDSYLLCFSKDFYKIRHFEEDFAEVFGRRTVLLCIATLKERLDYNFDADAKVMEFFRACQDNGKDTGVGSPESIETGSFTDFAIGLAREPVVGLDVMSLLSHNGFTFERGQRNNDLKGATIEAPVQETQNYSETPIDSDGLIATPAINDNILLGLAEIDPFQVNGNVFDDSFIPMEYRI